MLFLKNVVLFINLLKKGVCPKCIVIVQVIYMLGITSALSVLGERIRISIKKLILILILREAICVLKRSLKIIW